MAIAGNFLRCQPDNTCPLLRSFQRLPRKSRRNSKFLIGILKATHILSLTNLQLCFLLPLSQLPYPGLVPTSPGLYLASGPLLLLVFLPELPSCGPSHAWLLLHIWVSVQMYLLRPPLSPHDLKKPLTLHPFFSHAFVVTTL